MEQGEHRAQGILRANGLLIRQILDITSKRRRLSRTEELALSELVERQLARPDPDGLGRFRGSSTLASYLIVVVQKLYLVLTNGRPAEPTRPEDTSLKQAIRHTTSTLPSREALVVKMWFESGMTTRKIAAVLGMPAPEVHAVITERTQGVQDWLDRPQDPSDPAGEEPD